MLAPWIDNELKNIMVERDVARGKANRTGIKEDWEVYCKLQNKVTKIDRKNMFYKVKKVDINTMAKNCGVFLIK